MTRDASMLSAAARKVLTDAYRRPHPHYVCPTPGLFAACQTAVLRSLAQRRMITDSGTPTLTPIGIRAANDIIHGT